MGPNPIATVGPNGVDILTYTGWRVAMLVNGLDVEIVAFDGSPMRRLTIDLTKDYQRIP